MKIWLNSSHSKVLVMILEGKFSHKTLLFHVISHIKSLQIIWNEIQYGHLNILPFQSSYQSISFYFKSSLLEVGIFLSKSNHICIFIIKLLIQDQVPISKMKIMRLAKDIGTKWILQEPKNVTKMGHLFMHLPHKKLQPLETTLYVAYQMHNLVKMSSSFWSC